MDTLLSLQILLSFVSALYLCYTNFKFNIMEQKIMSFEELSDYISKVGIKHAETDSDEMGIYYEMNVFEKLILFAINDGYNPKKYDLKDKLAKWSYRKMISVCGRLEKDCAKNLMPEKTAILYKKIMADWWSL